MKPLTPSEIETIRVAEPSITTRELPVLRALAASYSEYEDFYFQNFKSICRRTKLPRAEVRRCARSLARKGFAKFGKGLWTEDGELAGSGYGCTKAGVAALTRARAALDEQRAER
jgi:DNA-binding IclR family transcriptional regulator